jgi:hypothetical protein
MLGIVSTQPFLLRQGSTNLVKSESASADLLEVVRLRFRRQRPIRYSQLQVPLAW